MGKAESSCVYKIILSLKVKAVPDFSSETGSFVVVWGGIEPPTQGFSVLCSTD